MASVVAIGHGQRGDVSVQTVAGRAVATKKRRPNAPAHCISREAYFLGIVNRYGIGPRLLESSNESVQYEFVEGTPILEHCQSSFTSRLEILDLLQQCFEQLLILDQLQINKHEMVRRYFCYFCLRRLSDLASV